MSLVLFNTLGRKVEEFKSLRPGKVGFYGCGPTVYNFAHIGNLRAYVSHDILARTLRRRGYELTHVMNITDVGHLTGDNDEGTDKMVKSAEERGKSVLEVASFYTDAFFKDTAMLGVVRPNIICKATEHIDDMIALIKKIEANGFTYSSGGNLYFDISKFASYGELARLKLESQKAGTRTEVDGNKRNPEDFVLWFTKSKFENQALVWDSPWGRGYPGWHIECAAMSIKYLGEQIDIHAGGIDHIQIHHSNEIAEAEAATGIHPWVNFWFHNEFLVLDRAKMSKSSGSFITLQSLIEQGFDPLDYRYFLLGGHYRTQLQFSIDSLQGGASSRKSLLSQLGVLLEKSGKSALDIEAGIRGKAAEYVAAFDEALDDDLSTPRALAALRTLVKDSEIKPEDALAAAFDMDSVLGLDLAKSLSKKAPDDALVNEVSNLIALRAQAKKARDFAAADSIRASLKERGIILEDTQNGTTWKRIS
jgi:cysteinyl-tRNA synthetase